jgi:hypothetical protein
LASLITATGKALGAGQPAAFGPLFFAFEAGTRNFQMHPNEIKHDRTERDEHLLSGHSLTHTQDES